MKIIIRPPVLQDAAAINEIRRMDGVRENTLGLSSEMLIRSESFIKNMDRSNHMFVAEVDDKVIGMASLMHNTHPRKHHSADVGISVSVTYQGQGVGTKLLEALLDLADNWLMLTRVQLGVLEGNDSAKRLYERFGFVEEGIKKMNVIRDGRYVDEIMMARIKVPDQLRDFKD